MNPPLSVGQCATLACLLEATAPKVGNVHRGADFADTTFTDFAVSSVAIAPAMQDAVQSGVGKAVLAAVTATRAVVSTNTNLGMVLLIAPLAAVPPSEPLTSDTVGQVLKKLSAVDAAAVYEAIRLARPGGLGTAKSLDVHEQAPPDLLTAMQLAAERDLVARQYVDNFQLVFESALPALLAGRVAGLSLTDAIVHTHLRLIAEHGDSLIARKCGAEVSQRAATIAAQVLAAGPPGNEDYYAALADFDFWLRSDNNRRNPGTTADLLAVTLFTALRNNELPPPWQ